MSAAQVGEQSAVVWNVLKRSPLSASRSKVGARIGPPNVLVAQKPTSSVIIRRTFGAPSRAVTPFEKLGAEFLTVRSILPLKGGSGLGKTTSSPTAAVTSIKKECQDAR